MKEAQFYIVEKTFDKILSYAHYAKDKFKSEIGGMCVILQDEDGDYQLVDPVILKQTISGGQCVLNQEELAKYYTKTGIKYQNANFKFCWWHSHHTLGAFWSKTDTDTMEEAANGDISYSLVVSWDKEQYGHIFRISYWNPIEAHVDTELTIIDKKVNKIPKAIMNEVEAKCNEPVAISSYGYYKGGTTGTLWGTYNRMETTSYNDSFNVKNDKLVEKDKICNAGSHEESVWDELNPTSPYLYAQEKLDELIQYIVEGTIEYAEYSRQIDALNKELQGSNCKVNKLDELNIDELLTSKPSDYITFEDAEEIDKIENSWSSHVI